MMLTNMRVSPQLKKIVSALTVILVIISAVNIGKNELKCDLFPDEFLYVYYAGLFKQIMELELDSPLLKSEERYYTVPAGFYWIGLTIYFSKNRSMLIKPQKFWTLQGPDYYQKIEFYAQNHPIPYVKEMIYVFREKMIIYRVACCLLLFILGWLLGGYWCSVLPVAWLLTNGLFQKLSSMVMVETIWVFQHLFNILLIYLYFILMQRNKIKPAVALAVLIGLSAGLLTATKISGTLNMVVYLSYAVIIWVKQILTGRADKSLRRNLLAHIFLALFSFLFIFIASNPALYTDTIVGIKKIFFYRFTILNSQLAMHPSLCLQNVFGRVVFINGCLGLNFLILAFLALGLLSITYSVLIFLKKEGLASIHLLVLLNFLILTFATLFFMKIAYERYTLALLPHICLIAGYGLVSLFQKQGKAFLRSCRLTR